jgi:CheY-like chemotaxis protein
MSPFQGAPAHVSLHEHNQREDLMIAVTTLSRRKTKQDTSSQPLAFGEIRVLVVDDHPAVRLGIRRLLEDQPDFVLAGVTGTAEAAMSIAEREPIDVVVSDYHLGSRNGLWLSRKLKRLPEPPRVPQPLWSLLCKIEDLPDVVLDRHAGHTRLGSRRPVARRNVG